MARKNRNARRKVEVIEQLDTPTPEQIARGSFQRDYVMDDNGLKAMAYRNTGGEVAGRTFKMWHLDRLHKAGVFSRDQYLAGRWYRDTHEAARYDNPSSSKLFRIEGSVTGGSDVVDAIQWRRDKWRAARQTIPLNMVGFIDAMLLHNKWPRMHHRQRFRTLEQVKEALDCIASFLSRRS